MMERRFKKMAILLRHVCRPVSLSFGITSMNVSKVRQILTVDKKLFAN